jgi:hypothetical protein
MGRSLLEADDRASLLARIDDDTKAGQGRCDEAAMRKKGDLPTKTCAVCARPFAWRKKWARVWQDVKYCSERCRRAARRGRSSRTAKVD